MAERTRTPFPEVLRRAKLGQSGTPYQQRRLAGAVKDLMSLVDRLMSSLDLDDGGDYEEYLRLRCLVRGE